MMVYREVTTPLYGDMAVHVSQDLSGVGASVIECYIWAAFSIREKNDIKSHTFQFCQQDDLHKEKIIVTMHDLFYIPSKLL